MSAHEAKGQEAFQNALTHLCCDTKLRSDFFSQGSAALTRFDLGENAIAMMESLPREELERYAEGILAKRWRELSGLVPCSQKVSPGLAKHYCTWLGNNPSPAEDSVLGPAQREGLRALHHIHTRLSLPCEVPYAGALFAFEVLSSCSRQDGETRYLHSNYPLHQLIPDILLGNSDIEVQRDALIYRFDSFGPRWKAKD